MLWVYTYFSATCFQFVITSSVPFFISVKKSISGIQSGPESFTGPDLDFMKEIEELARAFIETTEKTMALEELWEENAKFSGKVWSLIMNYFVY